MGKRYNPNAYADLLVEYLPGVIRSEKENEKAIEVAGRLMRKGKDGRSPEESRLLDLLVTLIEDFEEKAYPIGPSSPAVALRELMREHGLKHHRYVGDLRFARNCLTGPQRQARY